MCELVLGCFPGFGLNVDACVLHLPLSSLFLEWILGLIRRVVGMGVVV